MTQESQLAIRECIDRLYMILENVDHLFDDIDDLLSEHGFETLHSGYQTDLSKTKALGVLPRYLAGYYYPSVEDNDGQKEQRTVVNDTLAVSVVLADSQSRGVEPMLVGGIIRPRNPKTRYIAWWLFSAVYGNLDSFVIEGLPEGCVSKKGYVKSTADYWFDQAVYFAIPLTEFNNRKTVEERLVLPLCNLFDVVNSKR